MSSCYMFSLLVVIPDFMIHLFISMHTCMYVHVSKNSAIKKITEKQDSNILNNYDFRNAIMPYLYNSM